MMKRKFQLKGAFFMKHAKLSGLLTAAAMTIQILMSMPAAAVPEQPDAMRDITTMELVRDMGIGINLGNTMESAGDWIAQYSDGSVQAYETAWGSPVVTKDMIQGMADEGFGVVRIPVAWSNRMSTDGTYTIDSEYMERVQQLVDWALEADMYAIINIHWDNGWVNTFPDNKDENMKRFTTMWEQICDGFENYGDHLMFEAQNEELGWESLWNQWDQSTYGGKQTSYDLVNEINQKFVDTVRSSEGNNPERHLLISGYNTSIDLTCDPMFRMPDDPMDRCAVSVHYYTPAGFAILTEDASWAQNRTTWGTNEDFAELDQQMDMMKTNFIDKGIPVIIGEYGCPTSAENKDPASVRLFLSSVCRAAYERQMCPVLWSTPGGHYNRDTCKLDDGELAAQLREIVGDNVPQQPAETEPTTEPVTETMPTAPVTEPSETIRPDFPAGDIDHNGTCELTDVVILQKFLLGAGILPEGCGATADLYQDGCINVLDLALLKKLVFSK